MSDYTIFDYLKQIDQQNFCFYDSLTQDQQKKLSAFMMMMWLSFSRNDDQVSFINEIVNPYIFTLHKHPKLLWNLLCICGSGKSQKYEYRKREDKATTKKKSVELISLYHNCSLREAEVYMRLYKSYDDILELAVAMGLEKTELTELKKEWK